MARFFKKRNQTKGAVPGTPVFIGQQKIEETLIHIIDYDAEWLNESDLLDLQALAQYKTMENVTWINLYGLHDVEKIKTMGDIFELHPLIIEDIVNTDQRPKIEEYENCVFCILKMLNFDQTNKMIVAEQLSLVLLDNVLLTFQERPGDFFEPVRERLRKKKGRIRTRGGDYLTYALLDTVADNYVILIEKLGEQIEEIETGILDQITADMLENIKFFKREMIYVRKNLRPVKELVQYLNKAEIKYFDEQTKFFLKDLQDLIYQANDATDTYHDLLSNQLNIYQTHISNRMNDVMKVLTIFAAIFIPLTFIAGIYGTNFEYLPELKYRYAYFIFWGVMIVIAGGMLGFFRHKKWL
ncbi:MAG: magnesium/cobalt transporter CorA [Caldithrix sp.]|nr:magnesium/cobalt transporter CorA [Caldithrix sp.]